MHHTIVLYAEEALDSFRLSYNALFSDRANTEKILEEVLEQHFTYLLACNPNFIATEVVPLEFDGLSFYARNQTDKQLLTMIAHELFIKINAILFGLRPKERASFDYGLRRLTRDACILTHIPF